MYNEFNQHKKADRIKWIAVFLAIALLFVGVIVSLVISIQAGKDNAEPAVNAEQTLSDWSDENAVIKAIYNPVSVSNIKENENIRLAVAPMSSEANNYSVTKASVSKTITATVLPEDAPDKSIDWTVDWIVNPFGDNVPVSDYLVIMPEDDGSNVCTVTALQGFEGASMQVTATTRVGGFTASCIVSYDGAPEIIMLRSGSDIYENLDKATLIAGSTVVMTVDLDNTLGQVGSGYGNYQITSTGGTGIFVANKKTIVNGTVTSTTDENIEFENYLDQFISFSLEGDQLKIVVKKSPSAFIYPQTAVRTGTQWTYKAPYYDPRGGGAPSECIAYVVVEDTVSGKSMMLNVDITATINSINLDNTLIQF